MQPARANPIRRGEGTMKLGMLRAAVERRTAEIPPAAANAAALAAAGPPAAPPPPERLAKRSAHLGEGGLRPSRTELERLLGTNDLVDLNFLARGLAAARPVGRVILRDRAGRTLGYATG